MISVLREVEHFIIKMWQIEQLLALIYDVCYICIHELVNLYFTRFQLLHRFH